MLEMTSGELVDVPRIRPQDVQLSDIETSLSRMPRFAGHTRRIYTVLEHSVYCCREAKARKLSVQSQRMAICHDFSEAYLMDIPSPIKKLLPSYKTLESFVQGVIYSKFGVDPGDCGGVHEIDMDMRYLETQYLMPSKGVNCFGKFREIRCNQVKHNLMSYPSIEWVKEQFRLLCGELGLE